LLDVQLDCLLFLPRLHHGFACHRPPAQAKVPLVTLFVP
jgi:hypothetical protein